MATTPRKRESLYTWVQFITHMTRPRTGTATTVLDFHLLADLNPFPGYGLTPHFFVLRTHCVFFHVSHSRRDGSVPQMGPVE